MKKKLLAILIVTTMVAMLIIGCQASGGNNDSEEAAGDDSPKNPEDMTVGITVMSVGNDFMLRLSEGMKEAIEAKGPKVQLDSAEMDITTQIEQIENFTTMGCDIIVVWAVNGEGVASACQAAIEQGVKVVAFAMDIPGATSSIIPASEEYMAEQAVKMTNDWIDQTFPEAKDGDVKVLVVTSTLSPEMVARSETLMKIEENSKVTVISKETPDFNSSDVGRTLAENTFLETSDIDAVLSVNAATALGFDSYLVSSSSPITDKEHFGIFCIDESPEVVSKIEASETNDSLIRGTISLGGMDDTIKDIMKALEPLLEGKDPIQVKGDAKILTIETLN